MRNNVLLKITVGIAVALGIALAMAAVGYGELDRMSAREAAFAGRSVENGAKVFETNCVGCHGVKGEGIPGVAPALNSATLFTTRLQEVGYAGTLQSYLELTVAAGRPVGSGQYAGVMPTWGEEYGGPLRPDQVRDVAAFIMNWEHTAVASGETAPTTPTEIDLTGDPVEIGKAVYAKSGCAGCHGEPGSGGLIGPDLAGVATRGATTIAGMSAEDYIHQSIVDPNAHLVPDCPAGPCQPNLMPQTFGTTLSEGELNGLVQYLLTLQ